MNRLIASFMAVVVLLPLGVSAQSRFGNSGPVGQGGLSSSPTLGGPSQSAFSSSLGSSSLSSTGIGTSSVQGGGGNSISGSTSGGQTGTTGAMSGQSQLGADTIGAGPFVGRSDTTGRFVGSAVAGQQAAIPGTSVLGPTGFGTGFGQNQFGGNQFRGRGQLGQSTPERLQIRSSMRIGFQTPITTPAVATQRVATRIEGLSERHQQLSGVAVANDGEGRVVLQGTVPTEDARRLAAALVQLEPGVRQVVNELAVAPAVSP